MDMLMTGRRMAVDEAKHFGLVNRSCALSELQDSAIEWAHQIAKSAPLSLAAIKSVVRNTDQMDLESAYKVMRSGEIKAYQKMLNSDDAKEGTMAFSEKRAPTWKGK
jgi:crotonobetainyl-CoA hydratase